MAGTWNDIAREYRRASSINRIGRHVAWERITQPKPVDLTEVPPSPEALTKEYLTAILCGEYPGAEVRSIILGEESSGSGNRCAIELGYNEIGERAGLPKYLFHKCEKDFYVRLHLRRLEIDQNEPKFYSVIQPEVNIETPKAYLAAFDERSCRLSLLMEDVSREQGAVFFEVNSQVSRSDIEQMLSILAGLHAKYWGSERLDQEFTWLMNPARFSQKLIEGMELEQLTSNGLERAVSVLPASLAGRKDDIWNAFLAAMEISSRAPHTYLCGDPHLRNFYKLASGKIGLADWQVTMKGAWSHDFDYTLLTSLPIEQRRAWERELLAYYLGNLEGRGVTPPNPGEAWEIYRRQTLYTFVGWLVTIGFGDLQPSMQPDTESLEIIRRAAAAVEDLGSLEALLNQSA
ncbi:MAG: phosphotransferase [Halieaceae bacterium]|nr:phosphotransferase [Halieaceae bacterium]